MHDTAVLCAMANCLMRHDTTTRSLLHLRWQPGIENVLLSAREADLLRVAALLDAREVPAAYDTDPVRRIHQMVCATAAMSRFSERYMKRDRKQVLSASALFKLNAVFYTINPLASSHPVALKLAGMNADFRGQAWSRDVQCGRLHQTSSESLAWRAARWRAKTSPSWCFEPSGESAWAWINTACGNLARVFFGPILSHIYKIEEASRQEFHAHGMIASGIVQLDDLGRICTTTADAIVAWMESLTTSVTAA